MNGIWVRSQDRSSLVLAQRINVYKSGQEFRVANQVLYQSDCDDYDVLGEYPTKERALQVLDEIQQQIQNNTLRYRKEIGEEVYYQQCFVYEMPQE